MPSKRQRSFTKRLIIIMVLLSLGVGMFSVGAVSGGFSPPQTTPVFNVIPVSYQGQYYLQQENLVVDIQCTTSTQTTSGVLSTSTCTNPTLGFTIAYLVVGTVKYHLFFANSGAVPNVPLGSTVTVNGNLTKPSTWTSSSFTPAIIFDGDILVSSTYSTATQVTSTAVMNPQYVKISSATSLMVLGILFIALAVVLSLRWLR